MLLYIIVVILLYIIYSQNQIQDNQKLIQNNQQTLWLMMSNVKASIEDWYHSDDDTLETISLEEFSAQNKAKRKGK